MNICGYIVWNKDSRVKSKGQWNEKSWNFGHNSRISFAAMPTIPYSNLGFDTQ